MSRPAFHYCAGNGAPPVRSCGPVSMSATVVSGCPAIVVGWLLCLCLFFSLPDITKYSDAISASAATHTNKYIPSVIPIKIVSDFM